MINKLAIVGVKKLRAEAGAGVMILGIIAGARATGVTAGARTVGVTGARTVVVTSGNRVLVVAAALMKLKLGAENATGGVRIGVV